MKTIQTIKQDSDKAISIIEEENTHTKYIQKELKYYDKALYIQLKNMQNPYIPKIYVIQEKKNTLTILEEYVEGETLENAYFDKKEVQQIMHQLCLALKPLHQFSPPIIHRDIKPENVIYHNKKVTLIDFDIARFQDKNKSKDTQILGSVGYAAPEQFGFEQSNPQTDIYALGKLMNYLLNHSLENQNGISTDLKTVILKATQLDYKNRYKNVHEMDLAIQKKLIIFPCFNNETKKSRIISLLWTLFFIFISYDMKPGSTITNHIFNSLASFVFMYFALFLYYNQSFLKQHIRKIPLFLFNILIYFAFMCLDVWFFMFLNSFF